MKLVRIELDDKVKSKVRSLSGGQRRRVEIARSLLHRPKLLLLLDEPTVGLDIGSRQMILKHVKTLCKKNLAVLWATHLIDEIDKGEKVVIIHNGKSFESGDVSKVIKKKKKKI